MLKTSLACTCLIFIASAPLRAETPAEVKLAALKKELPEIFKKCHYLPLVEQDLADGGYMKISVCRMTSDSTAKLSFKECPGRKDSLSVAFIFEMKYYNGAWTIAHHEEAEVYKIHNNNLLLSIINSIDEFSP